jgi:hypothetical protein
MKLFIIPAIAIILAISTQGCKSSGADTPKLFCDTACFKDTLKFTGDQKEKPTVWLTANACKGDKLVWTYNGMGAERKTTFDYPDVKLNKNFVRCIFKGIEFAYIVFNDCATGRGYQVKLPFDKTQSFVMKTSGINNIDPKFSVSDNLLAYTDRGNIFLEEITTGKKASMTFGEKIDIDYDVIHNHIDSVNITNTRIWVKVKIGDNWKELENKITLE